MTVQSVLDEIRQRPGTGEVIAVVDPATEERVTEFKDCGPEADTDAVACAKASFESAGLTGLVRAARWTRPRCSAHYRLSVVDMAGLSGEHSGGVVDEFSHNVGVARMPTGSSKHMDQNLMQRDAAPVRGHDGTTPTAPR